MHDIRDTLNERHNHYGHFSGHAAVTQQLKTVAQIHCQMMDTPLTAEQAEAISMIFHKIGRILNGNPNHIDSWVDIAGYATLVADILSEAEETEETDKTDSSCGVWNSNP